MVVAQKTINKGIFQRGGGGTRRRLLSTDCSDRWRRRQRRYSRPLRLLTVAGVFLLLQLRSPEHKLVVDFPQVLEVVLLEADEAPEVGLARQRAAEAVDHVLPVLLLLDEEHVEHLLVAPTAVVRRLVALSTVEPETDDGMC